jgi:hypothetical protein
MNCKTANNLDLIGVLANYNVHPRIQSKSEARCLSPFRNETDPSFYVNVNKNVWYDFGEDKGGTVVDLIMKLHNCSIAEVLNILREKSFSFSQQNPPITNLVPSFNIDKICKIQKPSLISYLHSRKIDVSIAKTYCKEIYHSYNTLVPHSNNATKQQYDNAIKPYYAIALLNDKGGYEIRNKYFKGCLGPKAITTIKNDSDTLNVFESFSDFLSYLTLMPNKKNEDFAITNSTAMAKNIIGIIPNYGLIKTFFDNDKSGLRATQLLEKECKNEFINESLKFQNYKDVNDYLLSTT